MNRTSTAILTAGLGATVLVVGCSGRVDHVSAKASGKPPVPISTTLDPQASDANLILAMYDDINRAFQRRPDDGVRALITAQDPQDAADVNFARCVNAMAPGARTLPSSRKLHLFPNMATLRPDPGYTLTSHRVIGLHPQGRIYTTEVTMTMGGRPTVRERHQVVLAGRAYEFSTC